ncbi:beta-ketoacyl reductase, partial [Herpetosiphon giganteus]|uniref:beta-ketoacyl reductase n=1 Tax=Herpetosiphon giganteus TaxID=2029754 RepID=UPI001957C482
ANPATVVVPSLARDHRLIASLARAAGQLWAHGVALEWSSLIPPTTTPYPLPAYPWQHEDYWIEPSREISSQRASQTTSQPTLLGKKLQLPLKEQIYEQILDPEQMAFANAIRLYETPIVAYGLLTELLCQINTTLNLLSLSQISFKPQPLTSYQSRTVHGIICGSDQAQIELSAIGLLKAEDWQPLVSAQATTARISALAINIHQLCPNPEDLSSMFQQLSTIGWHGLEQTLPILEVWSGSGRLLIRLNSTELAKDWLGFAKALETLWQFGALVSQQQANTTPKVPNTIQQLTWQSNRDTPAWLYITVSDQNPLNVDAWLLDTHQQPILEAREISYNTLAYSDFIAQQHGSEWLYALEWHELSAPIAQATPNPLGFWIILPDAQGIAEHLATALKKIGWAIVWLKADDPNQLVTELASIQQAGSCQGVIDCRIIDLPALTAEIDQHVTEIAECCLQTIGLVQALVSVPAYAQSRIWLVTRGAQDVNSRHPVALEESALWGLGRAIALEHPAIWNGLIDLDPNQDFVADQLIADLHYSGSIREIAFRNGRRYESRLVQTPNAATDLAMPIREHASYLITGGLGGIGLETARRLAAEGAQSIILVGRRTPQASSQRIIDQLRATGTQITTIAADITNQTDIQQLFDQIDQTLPPLRGILHLAAQTSDAMLSEQTLAHFVQVLKPKLAGGWLLHQQTRDRDLDFLILFSSAAALFGAIGRSNYAAANAFLDGLASFRRSQGLPGLSLNWGAWAEVGMAAEALSTTQQTAMGAIKPLQGLNILANLRSKHQQLAIFPIQWQAFSALFPANRQPTLLSLCIDQNHSTIEADHALMRRLVAATQPERQELLIDLILTTARATLGFTTAIPIDKKVPLNQYGLDSILALDLRKRIQTSLGLDLPATLLFDYPTPELLADHLNTLISLPIAQPEITAEPEVDQLDLIEQLSDDEVDALFARILEQEGSND